MSPIAKAVSVGAAIGGAAVLGPQLLAAGLGKVAAAAGVALLGAGAASQQNPSKNRSPYHPGRAPYATSVDQIPNDCRGEYRIIDRDGNHKYNGVVVSENRSLQDRAREHQRSGMFAPELGDKFQYLRAREGVTAEEIYAHESGSIAKHMPYANKCKGGNGPR